MIPICTDTIHDMPALATTDMDTLAIMDTVTDSAAMAMEDMATGDMVTADTDMDILPGCT